MGGQDKLFFFPNLSANYFFFKWEGKAGRGDDPGQLKTFRQGGHIWGFNRYIFKGSFF